MDLRSAATKNYYQILGIDRDATTREVRSHYHDLARVYHPDSNYYADITCEKVSAEQIELFKLITAAYQTLIDPAKRAAYDLDLSSVLAERINLWDQQTDSVSEKPVLSTTASFGRIDYDRAPSPLKNPQTTARKRVDTAKINQEARARYLEAQMVAEMRKQAKRKRKTFFYASAGILIGAAIAFFVLQKSNFFAKYLDRLPLLKSELKKQS